MRIAMIAPVTASPEDTDVIKKTVNTLYDGLLDEGVDVRLFAEPFLPGEESNRDEGRLAKELKAFECLQFSGIFEQSDDYDLIHNHFNFLPLSYSCLINTPVLTTIYNPLAGEALPVFKKFSGRVFYVNDKKTPRPDGLDYIATVNHGLDDDDFDPGGMVRAYIDIYRTVIEIKQREDRRPWGRYSVLSDTREQKSKLVHVYPGTRLSLQRHRRRHEHWHIIRGEALVTLDGSEHRLKVGESIDIPRGALHRIANIGKEIMTFFEVQTGDYLGEDDIERLEDDYART